MLRLLALGDRLLAPAREAGQAATDAIGWSLEGHGKRVQRRADYVRMGRFRAFTDQGSRHRFRQSSAFRLSSFLSRHELPCVTCTVR